MLDIVRRGGHLYLHTKNEDTAELFFTSKHQDTEVLRSHLMTMQRRESHFSLHEFEELSSRAEM